MTTQQASPIQIVIQTELGNIEASIDTMRTPTTSTNFLKYVDADSYDGGRFHRTVWIDNQPQNDIKIEVIQAGINPDHDAHKFAPIRLERTHECGLRHRDGTLSMARFAPDSAQSD